MFPSSAGTIEKELSDGISKSTRLSSSMAASGSASGEGDAAEPTSQQMLERLWGE